MAESNLIGLNRAHLGKVHDVTALEGGVNDFCDDNTKALVTKSMTMEGGKGVKNCPKLQNFNIWTTPY